MPRLFAGLEVPEELSDELAGLEQPMPGARWVDPDNHHITLRFFGDISGRMVDELIDGLAAIETDFFNVQVRGIVTPPMRDPHSLWAGVELSDGLKRLQNATERAARSAGLAPERRPFRPHVTVARLNRTPDFVLARFLQRHAAFRAEPFAASRFCLYSAKPHTGGGPYVIEQIFPLVGGSWDDADDADGQFDWT